MPPRSTCNLTLLIVNFSDTQIPEFPKRNHRLDSDNGAGTTKSGKVKNKGPMRGRTKGMRNVPGGANG